MEQALGWDMYSAVSILVGIAALFTITGKTRQYPRGIQILVSTYLRGAPQVKIEKS